MIGEEIILKRNTPELHEWRAKYRKVRYCYACRNLYNVKDGFYRKKSSKSGLSTVKVYTRIENVCKKCRYLIRKKFYKIKPI